MSTRERILAAVRRSKPAPQALPDLPVDDQPKAGLPEAFRDAVRTVNGTVIDSPEEELSAVVSRLTQGRSVASALPALHPTVDLNAVDDPHDLADVEFVVCRGHVGVAENGAVWVSESDLAGLRAAPFLAQHLVLILKASQLVAGMIEACATVTVDRDGFGVWIAGPSKTADIEQVLVIGAHGPLELTVILTNG